MDVPVRLPLEPMDPKLTSIQPGGGPIFAWNWPGGDCGGDI